MSDQYEQDAHDDPVESGALEGGQGGGEAQSTDDPVESGALEEAQQGKGYGEDEGERGESL